MLNRSAPFQASSLGGILRQAVAESTLSRQDIAARAGISRRALYSLLEGDADPRLSTVEAIAHVLDLDVFIASKTVHAMKLYEPSDERLSGHSRVGRLLARESGATES